MIFVTIKAARRRPPVLQGPLNGSTLVSFSKSKGTTIAGALRQAMDRYRDSKTFAFVAAGATVHLPLNLQGGWDVAVYVDRISRPGKPGPFDGIGRIVLLTMFVRRSDATARLLARWSERNTLAPTKPESENLLLALSEMKDIAFCYLKPEFCWIEHEMRAFNIDAEPVIEHRFTDDPGGQKAFGTPQAVSVKFEEKPADRRPPEVLWVGHLYQYTGYGKANREILFRIANTFDVRIDDTHKEPCYVHESLRVRLDAHKQVLVGPKAPLLRFMGPDYLAPQERHRIVWTMMETSNRVHPDMVYRANKNFDEIWAPTKWNLEVFRDSGIRLPGHVMPLGVNPLIFRPRFQEKFRECKLISTSKRGLKGSPTGFVALTIGLPGFRKGWDVIADAFERAFAGRKDAHFVIGLTHAPPAWVEQVYKQFARYRANIWTLEGALSEGELADLYTDASVYVSASRGEGFNLPALEAAACGVRVILPNNTAHPEVFGPDALYFPTEGTQKYPEGDWISDWYKGMEFSRFGRKSISALAELLIETKSKWNANTTALRKRIIENFTWDIAASRVSERLLEVQP
jgi:glycosyltransferase involved in cell wall biosynthesis